MTRKFEQYYDLAEAMYVRQGEQLSDIMRRLPVCRNTVARWKKMGDWDRKKKDYRKSTFGRVERLEVLYDQALDEYEKNPSGAQLDKMSKFNVLLRDAQKPIDKRAAAIVVMEELAGFLKRRHPHLTETLADPFREFMQEVARDTP